MDPFAFALGAYWCCKKFVDDDDGEQKLFISQPTFFLALYYALLKAPQTHWFVGEEKLCEAKVKFIVSTNKAQMEELLVYLLPLRFIIFNLALLLFSLKTLQKFEWRNLCFFPVFTYIIKISVIAYGERELSKELNEKWYGKMRDKLLYRYSYLDQRESQRKSFAECEALKPIAAFCRSHSVPSFTSQSPRRPERADKLKQCRRKISEVEVYMRIY